MDEKRTGMNPETEAATRTPDQRPVISVIVPIFNEEEVIPELYRRMAAVLGSIGEPWELICVNDGSRDASLSMLLALREQDVRVKVIDFSRNFGQQLAITAGMDYVQGDAVVIIDADLQDPPELIGEMLGKWREGYEVVYAVRAERRGESRFKLWTASAFYRLLQRITDVEIPVNAGEFRLMDRQVILALRRLREKHRFMRGLSSWGRLPPDRHRISAGGALCRGNQISVEHDAAPDAGCDHEFQLHSPAPQHLLWIRPGAYQPAGDCRYNRFASVRQQRFFRSGVNVGCGAVSGRNSTDLSGDHR